MLLPRFSLRAMLLILSAAALVFLITSMGIVGRAWAAGLAMAVVSVVFTLLVHMLLYGLVSMLAQLLGAQEVVARTSRGGVVDGRPEPAPESPP
jgi:hypothetical protein